MRRESFTVASALATPAGALASAAQGALTATALVSSRAARRRAATAAAAAISATAAPVHAPTPALAASASTTFCAAFRAARR